MTKKVAQKAKNLARSVPARRPNSIVVYISAQNAIEDPFFFHSVISAQKVPKIGPKWPKK